MICFSCGRAGHRGVCPYSEKQAEQCDMDVMEKTTEGAGKEKTHGKDDEAHTGDFGPWMTAQTRRGRK